MSEVTTKTCSKCNETRTLVEFPKTGRICKLCRKEIDRINGKKRTERNRLKRERIAKGLPPLEAPAPVVLTSRVCRTCSVEKDISEFRLCKKTRNGTVTTSRRGNCNDCEKARGRAYRQSKVGKEKTKAWITENRERFSELQHNNYVKNKPQIRARYVERYKSDPEFQKEQRYRKSIVRIIRGSQQTNKYVKSTKANFLKWFSFNFDETMTWENYAKQWNVDHVIPLSEKNNGYDFEIIAKWCNIVPVDPKYNSTKNMHKDVKQASAHLERYKTYCAERKISADEQYIECLTRYISA